MATRDALYPLILPEVPQCPYLTVDTAINRAAAEFCRDSLCWNEMQSIALVSGQRQYPLTVPADSEVVAVRRASVDKSPPMRTEPMPGRILDQREAFGQPAVFAVLGADLLVTPTPNDDMTGKSMAVHVAFAPRFSAAAIPDVVATRFAEGVSAGARAILKRMVGNAWTDPQGSILADQLFRTLKAQARIEYEGGIAASDMRVTPRIFGGAVSWVR